MAEMWSVNKEGPNSSVGHSIVDVSEPLTLIGGGDIGSGDLALARSLAPTCVAADGGADAALDAGVPLAAVIGDMDSISDAAKSQIPATKLHEIAEQDSTDFDKVLRHVSAPLAIAVGFAGGRVDHELAALHTIVRRCDRRIVLLTAQDVVFHCPRVLSLNMSAGTRVSLFPMGAVRGRSTGLFWPIEGLEFAPGVLSGTSNKATGPLRLEMEGPGMLCILPRDFIQPVVSALSAVPAHGLWPARA